MKCQIQFSGGKKMSIINLSPAEFAHRVVEIQQAFFLCRFFFFFFRFFFFYLRNEYMYMYFLENNSKHN